MSLSPPIYSKFRSWIMGLTACSAILFLGLPTRAVEAQRHQTPASTYKKSWVDIALVEKEQPYGPGDDIAIVVDYYLDPTDADGGEAQLVVMPLGPYRGPEAKPVHLPYPGLYAQKAAVGAGGGKKAFHFKVNSVFPRNELNFAAQFEHSDGTPWPWLWTYQSRTTDPGKKSPRLAEKRSFFDLATAKPANLFAYEEPVVVNIKQLDGVRPGEKKELRYVLHDAYGEKTEGSVSFQTGSPGETVKVAINVKKRGIFAMEAEVADWGKRELIFARIPDVRRITKDKMTPFGATDLVTDRQNEIARLLGLTFCRQFFPWAKVEPAEGQWKFKDWDQIIATNKKYGIEPWLTVWCPPLWMLPDGVFGAVYAPFPFNEQKWRQSAQTLAEHFKGKIWGFEWLNEIVPGSETHHPIEDYLMFCRIGTEAAKSVDPNYQIQLAGGLWPRNYRQDVLKAGIAKYVNVLPIHYGTEDAVRDASEDLGNSGSESLALWDNETAKPAWVWNKEWPEIVRDTTQPELVLSRWPGELIAGAQRMTYFGGGVAGAAGGWDYLLDGEKPMPVAVTLAVLSSKLGLAKSVGRFYGGDRAAFYLFENDGKPVLVASSKAEGGESVTMDIGDSRATVTDYQGNETVLQARDGKLSVTLGQLPVFIEGGDLNYLKGKVVLSVGTGRLGIQSRLIRAKGVSFGMAVEARNPFSVPLSGKLAVTVPPGWPLVPPVPIEVPIGGKKTVQIPVSIPAGAAEGDAKLDIALLSSNRTTPDSRAEIGMTIIDPALLGNMILNGRFDESAQVPEKPSFWSPTRGATRQSGDGSLGIGNSVLELKDPTGKWVSAGQSVKVIPGQSYLYSVWVKTENMNAGGGSNVVQHYKDGTAKTFYTNLFFVTPPSTPWKFLYARVDASPETNELTLIPVASGSGRACYSNVRLSLYEGTPFATEAKRINAPIKLDGDLSEWNRDCPIPLLADNQLTTLDPSYQWSPENLSGVGYLCWDDKALYVAVQVRDNVHFAETTAEKTPEGDSVMVGVQPNRADGNGGQASMYYISSASPRAGSGAHTLYRPVEHSGGLPAEHLARDSSVYEMAIKTQGDITTYEIRIPWPELGNIRPALGAKFGFSLLLNDNDGKGRAAVMSWGGGLHPEWKPAKFGIVTLLEK